MAQILGSWKEIASYLGKGVRTVQRWEQELGLPVHRPQGARQGVVLAFQGELDAWARRNPAATQSSDGGSAAGQPNQRSRTELLQQTARLQSLAGTLLIRCQELAEKMQR